MLNETELPARAATDAPQPRAFSALRPACEMPGVLRASREADIDIEAIRAFARSGVASGDINAAEALWIVDLAPGDGERAWRVLNDIDADAERLPTLRYLACCASARQHDVLASHPYLHSLISAGRLLLDESGEATPPGQCNPFIVLAHEGLSARAQGLYVSHYGELLEAWVTEDGEQAVASASISWRPLSALDGLSNLLSAYPAALNSASLTLPLGAINRLERLLHASGGRMLLLASDCGACDLTQIRLGALATASPTDPAPVNFEALSRWHLARGGWVHQSQREDGARVMHIALHDTQHGNLGRCSAALRELQNPDDVLQLLHSLEHVHQAAGSRCLALLAAVGADSRALPLLSESLMEATRNAQGTALRNWRDMLSSVWAQHYPAADSEADELFLAMLAVSTDHWPLARRILQGLIRSGCSHAFCWQLLAQTQLRTGGARAALHSHAQAARLAPGDVDIQHAHQALHSRVAAWQGRAAYRQGLARDGELVLEPLDADHAQDFLYQYRDQQISMMTRLPELASEAQFSEWITERAVQTQRIDFAVMHATHGFVGVVSAHWEAEGAFIHYWLGADHQGRGLAGRATRLLLRLLNAQGIQRAFTAVYPDNHRSLKVLHGLGFTRLPLRARAPEEEMLFLAWSSDASPESTLCDALRGYARATASVFEFPDEAPMQSNPDPDPQGSAAEETRNE